MAVLVHSVVAIGDKHWIIFLTQWGGIVCVTYLLFGSALSIYYCKYTNPSKTSKGFGPSTFGAYDLELSPPAINETVPNDVRFQETSLANILPIIIRIYWMLANIAYVIGALIVILYWGFVHQERFLSGFDRAFSNVNLHGLVYLLVVIDFWMSSIPIRLMHVVYVIIFGVTYGLFSAIFTLVTGRWIYPILKWKTEPGVAVVFCLIAFGVILIVHMVFYGFDRFKKRHRAKSLIMP